MRDKYQQDGDGLGPLHGLVGLKFNWTSHTLKKHLYHSCRKEVDNKNNLRTHHLLCHDICDNDTDETV